MLSGSLIREARLRARLTQADLARLAGTTQSAIARWEAGQSSPSLERVRDLLSACGLDLRVALEPKDPGHSSLIESRLTLTPEQRLDDLTRTVAFLREGRKAMAEALGRQARGRRRARQRGRKAG